MFKRILSFIAALAMILVLLPYGADAASSISFGSTVTGSFKSGETSTDYDLTLPSSGRISVSAQAGLKIRLSVMSGDTSLWKLNVAANGSASGKADLMGGKYRFRVENTGSGTGDYSFRITFTPADETFPENNSSSTANNNVFKRASQAALATDIKAHLALNDTVDYFSFEPDIEGSFAFLFTTEIELRIDVYDENRTLIWGSDIAPGDFSSAEGAVYFKLHLLACRHYAVVSARRNNSGAYITGSYKLRLGERLKTPVISLENVASTGKIRISWEPVSGAEKYEVWRSLEKTGEYTRLGVTTNCRFTNTSAKAGTKYYYRVRAVSDPVTNIASALCSPKYRTCDLPQPTVRGTHNEDTGKNKLEWDAVDGASAYEIYRSAQKDGEYKLIKTVTKLDFTNTSVKAGETWYYRVVAVHENTAANSAPSAIKTLTCDLPRPVVTASITSSGKPKLTWPAIDGAKEYNVYRSLNGNDGWSLMLTTVNLSYTNTSAVSGTTYYYKVRAMHEISAANSAYSTVVSATAR